MAKVLVFEDHLGDLQFRYRSLTKKHSVGVRLFRKVKKSDIAKLAKEGFERGNIKEGFDHNEDYRADVYFLDGLDGDWIGIASRLGQLQKVDKERIYVNSSSSSIEGDARQRGYGIVDRETVDQIVEKLTGT